MNMDRFFFFFDELYFYCIEVLNNRRVLVVGIASWEC
jgi:hypothetical protein